MAGLMLFVLRRDVPAHFLGVGTAGMEPAALGWIGRRGDIPLQDDAVHLLIGVGIGDGGEQRLGIRMQRFAEDLLLGTELHHSAQIHDEDLIGNELNDTQIVRNEQICQAHILLQLFQQIDDLRLDGNVQGRNRLIANHQLRIDGKGAGDTDALALSAGEFVRIALKIVIPQAALFLMSLYL